MDKPEDHVVKSSDEILPPLITLTGMDRIWLTPLKGKEVAAGKIANHLIRIGACPRCIFRLLKVKDIKFYREAVEVRAPACYEYHIATNQSNLTFSRHFRR
jgi:hypothetical protein